MELEADSIVFLLLDFLLLDFLLLDFICAEDVVEKRYELEAVTQDMSVAVVEFGVVRMRMRGLTALPLMFFVEARDITEIILVCKRYALTSFHVGVQCSNGRNNGLRPTRSCLC